MNKFSIVLILLMACLIAPQQLFADAFPGSEVLGNATKNSITVSVSPARSLQKQWQPQKI